MDVAYYRGVMDLCPDDVNDQPMSKNFLHLMKRAENKQKQRKNRRKTSNDQSEPYVVCNYLSMWLPLYYAAVKVESSTPATTTQTSLKDEDDFKEIGEVKKEGPMFTRRKGETLKSYLERMDIEANAKIMEAYRKNRKPSDRRKR